jgi:hypothetical protein
MSNEKNKKSIKQEGNSYDKIFKENAVEIFRPLIEEELGIKIYAIPAVEKTKLRKQQRRLKLQRQRAKVPLI